MENGVPMEDIFGDEWEDKITQGFREQKRLAELAEEFGIDRDRVIRPITQGHVSFTDENYSEGGESEETENGDVSNVSETMKSKLDGYGVGVRAGSITPQIDDEESLRAEMGLPPMSLAAREAWKRDNGTRRPITIQATGEGEGEDIDEPNDPTTDDD